jgi:hypothetical protein
MPQVNFKPTAVMVQVAQQKFLSGLSDPIHFGK